MLTAVKGVYRQGRIELSEVPPDVEDVPVVVTFLDGGKKRKGRMMTFGMFPGLQSIPERLMEEAEDCGKGTLEKWDRANRDA